MKSEQITAVGYVLSTHESNLNFFLNFIRFTQGHISPTDYCKETKGTFKSFLNGYSVARNTKNEYTPILLNHAFEWFRADRTKKVDEFARMIQLEGLTHGKIATSLASKVMYLMNPWEVLPLDRLAKAGVEYKKNNYADYFAKVEQFRRKHEAEIRQPLESVAEMLDIIESPFVGQIKDLVKIRENRFVDKWLWVKGGNK